MASWIEVTVTTNPSAAEAVAAILHETRGGVVEAAADATTTTLQTYVPSGPAARATVEAIARRVASLREAGLDPAPATVNTRTISDEDWATAWKAFFHPLRVGRRIVIAPSWEPVEAEGADLVIILDPGMAFGTGQHPSTVLALELLEDTVRGGERVADVGTGSGILAIAAARLGAREVVAIDADALAVEVARANAAQNGVADRLTVVVGDLLEGVDGAFDAIAANITADVIVRLLPGAAACLASGGSVILSGIVEDRLDDIISSAEARGLRIRQVRGEGEWRAVAASR